MTGSSYKTNKVHSSKSTTLIFKQNYNPPAEQCSEFIRICYNWTSWIWIFPILQKLCKKIISTIKLANFVTLFV